MQARPTVAGLSVQVPVIQTCPNRLGHSRRRQLQPALASSRPSNSPLVAETMAGVEQQQQQQHSQLDDSADIVAAARQKTSRPSQSEQQSGALQGFFSKCAAAYRIFFPQRRKDMTPKDAGRNRLRMILVADRCAMDASCLTEMKSSIVAALSNYVEVETEEMVEVNVTTDPELGTIYSVAVPVKRVKPTARFGDFESQFEGIAEQVEWDEEDPDADPSSRFPFGT